MSEILLKTSIPGPKSTEWAKRRANATANAVSVATPLFVEYAEGAVLVDVDGNRFLDLAGGIGCMNVGHRDAAVTDAIQRQIDSYLHLCFQVTGYESYVTLAEKLNELTPGNFSKKTLLVNSGAEGVENAIKVARAYTKRTGVICFTEAFHGRTMLGLALTSKTHPYKTGFGPFVPEVYRLQFGAHLNEGNGKSHDEYVAMFEDAFHRVVAAENVAAIVLEPVQGEGGFKVADRTFLSAVSEVCRRYGIVFVVDEVQTGFGRTGKLFASEHFGVEPDLLVMAKSLGGGMPIGAVTGRTEMMDAVGPGGLGGTFSGNPLACVAALAVIKEFEDGKLLKRANELGEIFVQRAHAWKKSYASIADVRGLGAMRAIEFRNAGGEPDAAIAKRVVQECLSRGVVVLLAGVDSNVVRLLMPLMMSVADFKEALDVVEAALAAAAA